MAVRLGVIAGPRQAQLDGFKARELRALSMTAQSDLYATAWLARGKLGAASVAILAISDDEWKANKVDDTGTFVYFITAQDTEKKVVTDIRIGTTSRGRRPPWAALAHRDI